jgi:pyruvate kinase
MIKTKIIATLGPASADADTIRAMLDNGVDVFRLNFSHGSFDEHKKMLDTLNSVIAGQDRLVATIGDLCGPKIRTLVSNPDGFLLNVGDHVSIVRQGDVAENFYFSTNYRHFIDDLMPGHHIFVDDGQIELNVVRKNENQLLCDVISAGRLFSNKGINLPDTAVSIPSITDLDWQWVDWAVSRQLDFLALSFVRTADQIKQLKQHLQKAGSDIKVIAKIETAQSIEHLDDIVQACDAVLVARGDLGVEIDLAQVPLIQKKITALGRQFGKPVIVATQMLQSMISSPVPTRAEVSDIANAIMDFADAVMLSGETAVGKFPVQAVETINRIALVTESFLEKTDFLRPKVKTEQIYVITAAIARSVAQIVEDIDAKLVAVWSHTGSSARLLSKARIGTFIVVFNSNIRFCRQMSLDYGVIPFYRNVPESVEVFVKFVEQFLINHNLAKADDKIIIVVGEPVVAQGTKNAVLAHTIQAH